MEVLEQRVAVVTGAASGIGKAVAVALAAESMQVVLADIEQPPLEDTLNEIQLAGGVAVSQHCDVSDWTSVEALRAHCEATFGSPDVVVNNAGVAGGGSIAGLDLKAWEWMLAVNLWGVIYGVKAFLPAMIERGSGHVVNTGSIAGHLAATGMAAYNTSKHAVVGFSETLQQEMLEANTGVGVTCLCPGFVATNIINSERNRQERYRAVGLALKPDSSEDSVSSSLGDANEAIADLYAAQLDPAKVAAQLVAAIKTNQFWVFTDDLADEMIRQRHADIEGRVTPTKRSHLVELMTAKGDS